MPSTRGHGAPERSAAKRRKKCCEWHSTVALPMASTFSHPAVVDGIPVVLKDSEANGFRRVLPGQQPRKAFPKLHTAVAAQPAPSFQHQPRALRCPAHMAVLSASPRLYFAAASAARTYELSITYLADSLS